MFFSQVHLLPPLLPPMPTIRRTGTVPSWYIAFYKDSHISPWILRMVSQTQQDFLDAVLDVMQDVTRSLAVMGVFQNETSRIRIHLLVSAELHLGTYQ